MSRVIVLVMVTLVLSGCGFIGGAPSLESAVIEAAVRGPQSIVAGPDIRLARPIRGGSAVLYTYETDDAGQRLRWTSVAFVERRLWTWFNVGGGGGGTPVTQAEQPVEFGEGSGGSAGAMYRYAYGLVNDPAVTQVAVTFADGAREVVPVENGAYLVVRQSVLPGGAVGSARIDALDAQGTILHTNQP
jgi:hypothetical protein